MSKQYETISMALIRALYGDGKGVGYHWFDASTMRFFRTKLPRTGYRGVGGVFFVSSEQFVGSSGIPSPRKYCVRQLVEEGNIRTVGDTFNKLDRDEAVFQAKQYAIGNFKAEV